MVKTSRVMEPPLAQVIQRGTPTGEGVPARGTPFDHLNCTARRSVAVAPLSPCRAITLTPTGAVLSTVDTTGLRVCRTQRRQAPAPERCRQGQADSERTPTQGPPTGGRSPPKAPLNPRGCGLVLATLVSRRRRSVRAYDHTRIVPACVACAVAVRRAPCAVRHAPLRSSRCRASVRLSHHYWAEAPSNPGQGDVRWTSADPIRGPTHSNGGPMDINATLAHHETIATRSRKGRSSFRVTRRHARRMGDERTSAIELQRTADRILALAASYDLVSPSTGRTLPAEHVGDDDKGRPVFHASTALVGTDHGMSWGKVTDTDGDTDAAADLAQSVAHHRTSARAAVAHYFGLPESLCEVGDHGTIPEQPRHLASWPTRTRVTAGRFAPRANEHGTAAVANPFPSAWNVPSLTVHALAAPSDDGRVFIGNGAPVARQDARGKNAARDEARAEVATERKAEAVAAATSTSNGTAVIEAFSTAPDGAPVTVDLPAGGRVTFRKGAGKIRYTWTSGEHRSTWTSRTPVAAALRLATLGA
jgi:hypothetical protein